MQELTANVRAFDFPSAGLYDMLYASLLGGFYARVAGQVAGALSTGQLLEVSCGPGRLAARLAGAAPAVRVTGLDLRPAMVERARRRARRARLERRVRFVGGDVAALPFPARRFDVVVSTLALHHWDDPARALGEIYRVLAPGRAAWLYDVTRPLWPFAHEDPALARLAASSPFGGGRIESVRWPGPAPAFICLRLRRSR